MFQGMYTALITPFKANAVDYEALDDLIEWQLGCKVSGFVIGGTTGEAATLSTQERYEVLRHVLGVVNRRVQVIAGTGTNSTQVTLELTRAAKELGADGVLLVSPYYNKPTQEGLFAHFSQVAQRGGLPAILYNIPGRCSVEIQTDTLVRLSQLPEIVGVKDATGNAEKMMDLVARIGDGFALLSGEDALTHLMMTCRAKGVISASANVIPELMLEIVEKGASGDFSGSLEAQLKALPVIRSLFLETNPAPVKAALQLMGKIPSDALRLPLVSVQEETRASIRQALESIQ